METFTIEVTQAELSTIALAMQRFRDESVRNHYETQGASREFYAGNIRRCDSIIALAHETDPVGWDGTGDDDIPEGFRNNA